MKMTHDFEKNVATENGNLLDHQDQVELKNCVQNGSTMQLNHCELNSNLKSKMESDQDSSQHQPVDRFNFVYWIFVIHGIGILMPWNMFMTAKSYYTDYKLNVVTLDSAQDELLADFRSRFLSIAGVSSQIPNLVFNGLNLCLAYFASSIGGNLTNRIVGSIVINFVLLVFTLVMVLVDSSKWPLQFFYLTIGSIVLLNMSNGFYQNSIYGVAAQLPMRFTNAVILGNNVCGTLVSIMSIVSIAISPDPRLAAFYYFLNALIILAVCLCTYFLLPLSRFYRHYVTDVPSSATPLEQMQKLTNSNGPDKMNGASDTVQSKSTATSDAPSYAYVLRQCALQCSNVFVIFVVTLLLFPAVVSEVRPSTSGAAVSLPLPTQYFTPVVCYLAFNFCAMIGNMLPSLFMWPRPNHLHFAVLARLAFIPFFLLCNYKNHIYPVWFDSDIYYLIGTMTLGISHGHLSSLGMMYASKSVPEHASIAGMLAAFCLVSGIFTGISLSFVF